MRRAVSLRSVLVTVASIAVLLLSGVGERRVDAESTIAWTPDLIHSRAEFTVAHLVLSKVWGHFPIRAMQIETRPGEIVPMKISATMDVAKLDTDNHMRDADLRSETYLDTDRYPTIGFASTKITPIDTANFTVTGVLTIKNISKTVTFPVHIIGKIPADGGTRVGYEASLHVDRRDFGITDNRLMEGVLFVGYDVTIGLTAEASSSLPFKK